MFLLSLVVRYCSVIQAPFQWFNVKNLFFQYLMPHRLLDLRIMYVWRYQRSVFISLHDSCILFVNIVELIYSTLSLPHKKLVFFSQVCFDTAIYCGSTIHNAKNQNEWNASQTTHLLSLLIYGHNVAKLHTHWQPPGAPPQDYRSYM